MVICVLDDELAGALVRRYAPYSDAGAPSPGALRVQVGREARDYFIEPPERIEFNPVWLAFDGDRIRYAAYRLAGWFDVRANDGTATSAWSSAGEGSVCRFVYDDVSPEKAVITSQAYPEDQIRDGVGVYGGFTMDSPSPDVVEYRYGFVGGPYGTVRPDEMGGPAILRFLPLKSGAGEQTMMKGKG